MTIANLLTVVGLLFMAVFVVFAFSRGTRVKARSNAQGSAIPGEDDSSSSGWGTHIDSGGSHGGADSGAGH